MKASSTLVAVLVSSMCLAQHDMHAMNAAPEALRTGLGAVHHSVSTKNPLAQKFFDQGLALYYGFNHTASVRSFKRAYELDPSLAMAHWGVALAEGPNINMDVTPENEKDAFKEVQQAKALEGNASPEEKALIEALATRYSNEDKPDLAKLSSDYSASMGEVHKQYPTDPDAASLYAESIMDLHPWRLWSADGKPTDGTLECIGVLKETLKTNPNHIGANHFLIHAVEASPHPEDALVSAQRLDVLAPNSGHLVHMPSHIYIRTGRYHEGVLANEKALAVDARYLEKAKDAGFYPMYYLHNFDMLRHAANMEGNFAKSQAATDQIALKMQRMVGMPTPDGFQAVPFLNLVRFRKWDEILARPIPNADPSGMTLIHFAKGMAYAGKGNSAGANSEYEAMKAAEKTVTATAMWNFTPMSQVIGISQNLLEARIARAAGDQSGELTHLKDAVAAQSQIGYDEPPDYFFPTRESLGSALLRAGKPDQAEEVFRADLAANPGNGRSLFGLWQALKAEGKAADAARARREYEQSWKWADTQLTLEDL